MRRIRVDLMFDFNSDADDVWNALKTYLKNKSVRNTVNEKSFIEYENCHHLDSPPSPCEIIARFEK